MRSQELQLEPSVTPSRTSPSRIASVQKNAAAYAFHPEETLVIDERATRRPSQAVEDKLTQILGSTCVGVSHLRLKALVGSRTSQE
jgi:hypothetical protein